MPRRAKRSFLLAVINDNSFWSSLRSFQFFSRLEHSDFEDVCQITRLRLYVCRKTFVSVDAAKKYAVVAAKNTAREFLRQKSRQLEIMRRVHDDAVARLQAEGLTTSADKQGPVSRDNQPYDIGLLIKQCVDHQHGPALYLDLCFRRTFAAKRVNVADRARILGLSPSTFHSRVKRGFAAIRKYFEA